MTNSNNRSTTIGEHYKPETPKEKEGVDAILAELTEEEKSEMTDDGMPLRYFRAEKSNVKQAIKKLRATLAWRKEFGVSQLVDCVHNGKDQELVDMMKEEHETGKRYVRGYDDNGRALIYTRVERENTYHRQNNIRSIVWTVEKALSCSAKSTTEKPAADQVSFVLDMENFKLSKLPPLSVAVEQLNIVQHHYPERLHRAYVVNPTLMFRTFWRIFRPFVDPTTKEKVVFCTGKVSIADHVPDPAKLEPSVGGIDEKIMEFDHEEYFNLPFDVVFDE